jgi:hypothetical protein
VIDEYKKPLSDARVTFGSMSCKTDTSGRFLLEIPGENNKESLLTISFEDLIPVVRNYHPAMGSTNYDVVMVERKGPHVMGIMLPFWDNIATPELHFRQGFTLTSDHRLCLNKLASDLRNNPSTPALQIVGFGKSPQQQKLARKRAQQVHDFLVNQQGVSAERFKIVIDSDADTGFVEFRFDDE